MKKQIRFASLDDRYKTRKAHGGSIGLGKRKSKRPIDQKKPIHLVLKTTNTFTLLKNRQQVDKILVNCNRKFGIKLHSKAIQYDHIHLNLSFQNRQVYLRWIRALTGTLALKIKSLKFKFLPWTRVIENWGRGFNLVQTYIEKNQAEADFLWRIHSYIDSSQIKLCENLKESGFRRL